MTGYQKDVEIGFKVKSCSSLCRRCHSCDEIKGVLLCRMDHKEIFNLDDLRVKNVPYLPRERSSVEVLLADFSNFGIDFSFELKLPECHSRV